MITVGSTVSELCFCRSEVNSSSWVLISHLGTLIYKEFPAGSKLADLDGSFIVCAWNFLRNQVLGSVFCCMCSEDSVMSKSVSCVCMPLHLKCDWGLRSETGVSEILLSLVVSNPVLERWQFI